MSFVDIGTLTEHRRNEMEGRVKYFLEKCDLAVRHIQKMKIQAQELKNKLNCNPAELKDYFLSCMKQLDEFTYFITDFNIAASVFDDKDVDYTPVYDGPQKLLTPLRPDNLNLMDVLSEPCPTASKTCLSNCKNVKQKKKKPPKTEHVLIAFSSTSNSDESVNKSKKDFVATKETEVQCQIIDDMQKVSVSVEASPPTFFEMQNLPAQSVLQADQSYSAVIMCVDGTSFYVITENFNEFYDLLIDLNTYYRDNELELTAEQVSKLIYCACYDKVNDSFFRGMIINQLKDDHSLVEVYLVDTGNVQNVTFDCVQPLIPRFCERPPFARCCHLVGVDLLAGTNKDLDVKQEQFLSKYLSEECTIEVDDNTSESLGVYVKLQDGNYLNDLMVQQGLAVLAESPEKHPKKVQGPPEVVPAYETDECPEHEDALMAVAGYSNRDEAEICKHYKGGPEKTCFKGNNCKKRHVMMHPDGWTLDRVEVLTKCRSQALPAPNSIISVIVTCVCHFDRVFVQIPSQDEEKPPPSFGVVLPPTTLKALFRDMNSEATKLAFKRLTLAPAPGELVAAIYPMDGHWYRARVQTVSRMDQTLQVMYIDYGNIVWIKEDTIRVLDPRFTVLPEQAICCKLAGVQPAGTNSSIWAQAKTDLTDMTLDKKLDALVVSRCYDELTIELYDSQGYSVSELLAARNLITLTEFSVEDDTQTRTKHVVP